MPNSSWERAVADHLVIDHVGHRGDGVSLVTGDAVYVPYALGGETVRFRLQIKRNGTTEPRLYAMYLR